MFRLRRVWTGRLGEGSTVVASALHRSAKGAAGEARTSRRSTVSRGQLHRLYTFTEALYIDNHSYFHYVNFIN